MARYIDADIVREKIEALYEHHLEMGNFSADNACSDCLELLDDTPTADVVPSAEVERLQHILDCYALQYGTVKDQQSAIDKAKAEVAKEIGEEIYRIIGDGDNETWICLLIRELADKLTKKDESQN